MPVTDPLETLKWLQTIVTLSIIASFGITIYQVFLNRTQAKVKKQMEELIAEVKDFHKTIREKWKEN